MRIGIDARALAKNYHSGIAVYLKNILHNLPEDAGKDEIYLYTHTAAEIESLPSYCTVRSGCCNLPGTIWSQTELPWMIKRDCLDVFWGPIQILPLLGQAKTKTALTLHDFVYRRYPETMELKNRFIHTLLAPLSIKKTDVVFCDSQQTKNDLSRYFPHHDKPVHIMYPSIENIFVALDKNKARISVQNKYSITKPYILIVGTLEPRKNLITAFEAFAAVADKIPHQLVSVGYMGWKMKNVLNEIKNSTLAEKITFLNYVKREDMPMLYSGADLFLFPSLYEGFGLPPLEAMACGCPVISSNTASLPEVIGTAGMLLPPTSIDRWKESILKVLSDPAFSHRMSAQGTAQAQLFDSRKTAKKVWEVLQKL